MAVHKTRISERPFEETMIKLHRNDCVQCPYCLQGVAKFRILEHIKTHFQERNKKSNPIYPMPVLFVRGDSRKSPGVVPCFVKNCDQAVDLANGSHKINQQIIWREHLLQHKPEQLARYGINHDLLVEDQKLYNNINEIKQSRELIHQCLDDQLSANLIDQLEESHLIIYEKMVNFLKNPVSQGQPPLSYNQEVA